LNQKFVTTQIVWWRTPRTTEFFSGFSLREAQAETAVLSGSIPLVPSSIPSANFASGAGYARATRKIGMLFK
jgi:hypothetical protein